MPRDSALPSAYRDAQLRARAMAGDLTQEAARRVVGSVNQFAGDLALQISDLPLGSDRRKQLARARLITVNASKGLSAKLQEAVASHRTLAYTEVASIWHEASHALIASQDLGGLLGRVQAPNLAMAGAYESLGGASYLRSLNATAVDAAAEVSNIIRDGLVASVSPAELAKRLEPYMRGAETFEAAFPAKDERFRAMRRARDSQMSPEIRGAAFRARSNALRVAYSEVHNARAEAELQAFAVDPMVNAIRWALSPFRGSGGGDVCDGLAANDWYGLGAGIYPLDAVPLPPHPRDRCERYPVMKEPGKVHEPKPVGLERRNVPASFGEGAKDMTAADRQRHLRALDRALSVRDSDAGRKASTAMRKLVKEGDARAAELESIAAARRKSRPAPVPAPTPAPAPRPAPRVEPQGLAARLPGWNGPSGAAVREHFAEEAAAAKAAQVQASAEAERIATVRDEALRAAGVDDHAFEALRLRASAERDMVERTRLYDEIRAAYTRRQEITGQYSRQIIEARQAGGQAEKALANKVAAVLKSDTANQSTIVFQSRFTGERKAQYEHAVQRFRELWGDRVPPEATYHIRANRGRSHYARAQRSANMDTHAGPGVLIHELTHGVEFDVPALHRRAVAYRDARAVGERPVKLKSVYPNHAYKSEEITLRDKWIEKGGDAYTGKVYPYAATEVLTMGIQRLAESPVAFMRDDPDFFDFIVETLWGAVDGLP